MLFDHILFPIIKANRTAAATLKFERKDRFIFMTYKNFPQRILNSWPVPVYLITHKNAPYLYL